MTPPPAVIPALNQVGWHVRIEMQSTVLLLLSVLFLCVCLYLCLSYVGGAFLHPRTRPQFVTCKDSGVIYVDTMGSVKKRWASRGYPQSKIQENVQAEIMQVLLEESRDSYKPEIVKELQNDTIEQLEQNVVNAVKFVQGVV